MKKWILFFLLASNYCFAQNSKSVIDSLESVVLSSEGLALADAQAKLASMVMTADLKRADSLIRKSIELYKDLNEIKKAIKARLLRASIENQRYNLLESREILKEAIQESEEIEFHEGLAFAYSTLGSQVLRSGLYSESLELFFKALSSAEKLNLVDIQIINLMNIGLVKQKTGEFEEAEQYWLRGIELCVTPESDFREAQFLLNLGTLEYSKNNIGLSIDYNRRALEVFQSFDDKTNSAICFQNIGYAYASMGDRDNATEYYDQALNIRTKTKDSVGIARIYLNKALLESSFEKYTSGIEFGLKALSFLNVEGQFSLRTDIYKLLSENYEQTGAPVVALDFHKRYAVARDSLQSTSSKSTMDRLTSKFEIERHEREMETKEKLLIASNEQRDLLASRQSALLVITVLLLLFMVMLIISLRVKLSHSRLTKEFLKQKAHSIELEKVNIRNELTTYVELLNQKNEFLLKSEARIKELEEVQENTTADLRVEAKRVERLVGNNISWEEFRIMFDKVHSNFIPNLIADFPDLTSNELDISVLLKLNLNSKDMAKTLNMSYDSVKKSLQRFYKKIGMSSNEELRSYILRL